VVNAAEYGVPQLRKRLILLASRLGEITIPRGPYRRPHEWRTVRQTIGHLPPLEAGEADPHDPLHIAPRPSALSMLRIAATPRNGGTWRDWADNAAMQCRWGDSKAGCFSAYGRMRWDRPGYTITSHCTEASSGPYVHPEQHRPITLREAALLQSFPRSYRFWPPDEKVNRKAVARMIGNAVPPLLATALGKAIMQHVVAPEKNFTLFS